MFIRWEPNKINSLLFFSFEALFFTEGIQYFSLPTAQTGIEVIWKEYK